MNTEFEDLFFDGFDDLLCLMGEQVVYHPRCGSPRYVDAIVDRNPGEVLVNGEIVAPSLTVRVHNDRDCGIDHNEIDNGDQVAVSLRPRGKLKRQTFSVVENSDGGVTDIAVL